MLNKVLKCVIVLSIVWKEGMYMIFALIGHSASGKSTVESNLEGLGYARIISYTTRKCRENEKDGVAYHFIDTDTFYRLHDEGFFAETAQYREWLYGLSLDEIHYGTKDYIVVVTVHGYEELVKFCGQDNIIGIHIKVEERDRIIRQLKRGDEVDEVIRRIYTDRVDFAGVEDACEYVVVNNHMIKTLEDVISIIKHRGNAK
jgi:guanylate kinase